MNILFLYNLPINPQSGGVERVSSVLASYFKKNACAVYYLSGYNNNTIITNEIQFFLPEPGKFSSKKNTSYFLRLLHMKKIDVVINQGGMNPDLSRLAYSSKESNVKLISVIHNSLLASINYFTFSHGEILKEKSLGSLLPLFNTSCMKFILLNFYRLKYKEHYKQLIASSDKVFLLSNRFRKELSFIINSSNITNVLGISNPVSFSPQKKHFTKKKELLYVGRIDRAQKRVDLLIKIWEFIYKDYPEWSLRIVGDGIERNSLMQYCKEMHIKNIYFEGFQNPEKYYETASILCMTSSYEGFPLVIAEAMQYGVVPFAFSSYQAVYDLIDNEENGIIIPPFNISHYVSKLHSVMKNEEYRLRMSHQAIQKSENFSLEKIGSMWIKIMHELCNDASQSRF